MLKHSDLTDKKRHCSLVGLLGVAAALLGACKSDWTAVGDTLIGSDSRLVYLDDQPVQTQW